MMWLKLLYPIWSKITPTDLAAATSAACAELMLTGCTTTADHSYLLPNGNPEFVDEEVGAALRLGIRLHLVRGSLTTLEGTLANELSQALGDRAGGLLDREKDVLADMRRAASRYHDGSFGSNIAIAFGPTTVTYENKRFMRDVAALASDFGCGLHTHFHPRQDERDSAADLYGETPAEFLKDVRWLRPGTWFAHSSRLNETEMDALAKNRCGIAHCPRMIMRLGARVPPIHTYRERGITVGVGVDGAASNDAGSMIGELRLVPLLHRLFGGEGDVPHSKWIDPYDALLMATKNGASILGRSDIGSLSIGKAADVTAFSLKAIGYAGAVKDPLSALVLAGSETRAALTMIDGKVRVRDGVLCGVDENHLKQALDIAALRVVNAAEKMTGINYDRYPERDQESP